MIEVTENENGSFTISWDENSPTESILSTWTEEDFINEIRQFIEKLNEEDTKD